MSVFSGYWLWLAAESDIEFRGLNSGI